MILIQFVTFENEYNSGLIVYLNLQLVNCEWGEWRVGECSKTCGGGTKTNRRSPNVNAVFGGESCSGPSNITEVCNIQECPGKTLSMILFCIT